MNSILLFCKNIKALREHHKLSKKAMCKILKISIRSLNSIESEVLPPKTNCDVLIRACIYFKISPEVMLSKNVIEYINL